ncbi:MAG: pentapeptide repeat-containing protein, partial [Alphaproteobacteria bacterium]|nr:pentapeptide repeat-containing protein [Alphaproteobacteria bacterium]
LANARISGVQEKRISLFKSKLNGSDLDETNLANVDLSEVNLNAPWHGQNTFSIRKYYVTNKHGLNHGCYNAKLHTT